MLQMLAPTIAALPLAPRVGSSSSLVFDFEELDVLTTSPRLPARLRRLMRLATSVREETPEMQEVWTAAEDARAACQPNRLLVDLDVQAFARHIKQALGARVALRSGPQHTFVVVELQNGQLVIVDPHFAQQFSLGSASDSYRDMLDAMPPIFCGSAQHLDAMVTLLCEEVERTFAARSLAPPPWRTRKAMLARWLVPNTDSDVIVE